jgi:hypothetical protein
MSCEVLCVLGISIEFHSISHDSIVQRNVYTFVKAAMTSWTLRAVHRR